MKLQTKLICAFALTVFVVVMTVGMVLVMSANHQVRGLSSSNLELLGKQQIERATGVNQAIQFSMQRFLDKGEMEVFGQIAALQQQIQGFKEFSLYNDKGTITYSSDKNVLKQSIPAELKSRLYNQPETLVRQAGQFLEIYQPQVARASCVECHTDWKVGNVCGVTVCRFSTEAIEAMKTQCQSGVDNLRQAGLRNSVACMLGGIVFGCLIAYFVTRSVTRPVVQLTEALSAASEQTSGAAAQVAEASQALASSASEQAASSEESSASIMTMRDQARKSTDLTNGAAEMMKENLRKSGDSLRAIVDMNRRMGEMQANSGEMGKIIKTIDEIAFQTNILALNAAVEAARAGEAGAGFAVVAEEVRGLAMRSAEAAKNTQTLLDSMANRIVESAGAIKGINDNFEAIVETATSMGDKIEQVTSTSGDFMSALEQVNTASGQGAEVAQKVAAASEETGSASEELSAQAVEMRSIAARLEALVKDSDSGVGVRAVSRRRAGAETLRFGRILGSSRSQSPEIAAPQEETADAE
jgi:methyl-accepting chemotaxis protein